MSNNTRASIGILILGIFSLLTGEFEHTFNCGIALIVLGGMKDSE
jgi:hypothetical protein